MPKATPEPLSREEIAALMYANADSCHNWGSIAEEAIARCLATIKARETEVEQLRQALKLISYKTHHTLHPSGPRAPGVLPGMWHSLSFTDPEIEMIDAALAASSPPEPTP